MPLKNKSISKFVIKIPSIKESYRILSKGEIAWIGSTNLKNGNMIILQ